MNCAYFDCVYAVNCKVVVNKFIWKNVSIWIACFKRKLVCLSVCVCRAVGNGKKTCQPQWRLNTGASTTKTITFTWTRKKKLYKMRLHMCKDQQYEKLNHALLSCLFFPVCLNDSSGCFFVSLVCSFNFIFILSANEVLRMLCDFFFFFVIH